MEELKDMMKNEFMNKARENLKAARVCFDNELFNACVNRAYYSALQGAVAALAHAGIKRSKVDHGQVQADFSRELIHRRKIYPAKLKSYLSDMQLVRNQADYTGEMISRKVSLKWLAKAEELLKYTEKEIS